MTLFQLNLRGFCEIHSLENIYKSSNKILGKMSLVTGRLTFLSIWKNAVHKQLWRRSYSYSTKWLFLKHRNDPSWFIIGGMEKGEATVCVFIILSTGFLLPLLCSHNRILWFLPFFSVFSRFFLQLWEGQDQEAGIMTQSDSHTQKLNAGNEGKAIGRAIGISTGSSDRPIVQNLSFFDNT